MRRTIAVLTAIAALAAAVPATALAGQGGAKPVPPSAIPGNGPDEASDNARNPVIGPSNRFIRGKEDWDF